MARHEVVGDIDLATFEKNNCGACTYNCTNGEVLIPPLKNGGRTRFLRTIKLADHSLKIQDCPARRYIMEKRDGTNILKWPFIRNRVIEAAEALMDQPSRVDQVAELLLNSKVPQV